jgi:hypothetical protein
MIVSKHFTGSAACPQNYETPMTVSVEISSESTLCISGVNDAEGYQYQEFEW